MSLHPLQRKVQGDASETAILQYSEIVHGDVEAYRARNKKVCDVPFNSANKYQVSIHETDDGDERHLLVVILNNYQINKNVSRESSTLFYLDERCTRTYS